MGTGFPAVPSEMVRLQTLTVITIEGKTSSLWAAAKSRMRQIVDEESKE